MTVHSHNKATLNKIPWTSKCYINNLDWSKAQDIHSLQLIESGLRNKAPSNRNLQTWLSFGFAFSRLVRHLRKNRDSLTEGNLYNNTSHVWLLTIYSCYALAHILQSAKMRCKSKFIVFLQVNLQTNMETRSCHTRHNNITSTVLCNK